jgi:hypothetical protein
MWLTHHYTLTSKFVLFTTYLIDGQLFKEFHAFTQLKNSSYSQQPAIEPRHDPDEMSPETLIQFLQNLSEY